MDEIQNIIIQVKGQEKIDSLERSLANYTSKMNQIIDRNRTNTAWDPTTDPLMQFNARMIERANRQIEQTASEMKSAGGRFRIGQQGVMNLGYAIQDFVSTSGGFAQKMNSVTNNLQVFATSMGAGGGVFIGVTAAMSALQLFANNWEKIGDALTGFDRAKFDEVTKKAADLQSQFQQLANTPTKAAGKSQDAWKNAITEAGAGNLQKDITESLFNSPFGAKMTPEDREAMTEAGRRRIVGGGPLSGPGSPESDEAVRKRVGELGKQIQDRLARENARKADEMVAQAAGTGPDAEQARKNLMRLQRENPGTPTLGKFDPWQAEFDENMEKQAGWWSAEDQKEEDDKRAAAMMRTNNAYGHRQKNEDEAKRNEQEKARINERLNRQQERRANGPLPDYGAVQRRQIGEEFNARSLDEGVQWSPDQVQQATQFIQQGINQGGDAMTLMQQAFGSLMQQAQMMQQRMQQQAQMMNSAFNFGAMGGPAVETPMYWTGQFPGG